MSRFNDDHKLAALLFGMGREMRENLRGRTDSRLFVHLGELPEQADPPVGQKRGKFFKRLHDAVRRFIKDAGSLACGNFFEQRLAAFFERQESVEREALRAKPRDRERCGKR